MSLKDVLGGGLVPDEEELAQLEGDRSRPDLGCGWNVYFQSKPHRWKRHILRRPWGAPVVALPLAAICVQRAWRGRSCHRPVDEPLSPRARGAGAREALRQRYLALMQRTLEGRFSIVRTLSRHPGYRNFEHFCAAILQGWWLERRHPDSPLNRARKLLLWRRHALPQVAALVIQAAARPMVARRLGIGRDWGIPADRLDELREKGASKLQRAWQSRGDRRLFAAIRDMLLFRNQGDPAQLLRSMCPREAQLLDPAMRACVRFRLGGSTFPPKIYYKIFAKAVVDLGAFAPRAYCLPGKPIEYAREDNNGWRILATRVETEQLVETPRAFHHDPKIRHAKHEAKRKRRKLLWLERLQQMNEEALREQALERAARGGESMSEYDADVDGEYAVAPYEEFAAREDRVLLQTMTGTDWSDAQLVEWSRHLDFDAYLQDWATSATSRISDGKVVMPAPVCKEEEK